MKILFVSTSDNIGGAAVATNRLVRAVNRLPGIEATLLVRDKTTSWPFVTPLPRKKIGKWMFLAERLLAFFHLRMKKKNLWDIDAGEFGEDITNLPAFKAADVIHLEWINQGMLSLDGLRKIIASGKPVVWTLHDLWPVSGICHYTRRCDRFITGCKECQFLPAQIIHYDLARRVWEKKRNIYRDSGIHFVACSEWLANLARMSGLTTGLSISAIPNPIDTRVFHPYDKWEARKELGLPLVGKNVVLFVSQKLTDARKGASLLIKALGKIRTYHPHTAASIVVALLGSHSDELISRIHFPIFELGYITGDERLAKVYSAADVFVLPSTEDNLPNTIMEALACGVPCVGFDVGGIPEMIDHLQNGYVAPVGNTADFAAGIRWVLKNQDDVPLAGNAVKKVRTMYSEKAVTEKYIEIYQTMIAAKKQL
ncbi:MAG: glycosyltransferase [Prevotella sp.]|nr:glycosyltransferase [Prevotella sp.]